KRIDRVQCGDLPVARVTVLNVALSAVSVFAAQCAAEQRFQIVLDPLTINLHVKFISAFSSSADFPSIACARRKSGILRFPPESPESLRFPESLIHPPQA